MAAQSAPPLPVVGNEDAVATESFLEALVMGIFRPGTNKQTFDSLNIVLVALFASILYMWVGGIRSVHVYVLSLLAAGLFFSLNWCAAL